MLDAAADALLRGDIVVIPTDTVYGIAVATSVPGATERIFELKERSRELPLPVIVADEAQAREIAEVSKVAAELMQQHWPGGLTIVLPRKAGFDVDLGGVGGSRDTVGVRVPDHHVPVALARRVGPLATTSANRHGKSTPATAAEVMAELGLEVAIDAGPCEGMPSTVISVIGSTVEVLRQGAVILRKR